jgi:hypothetical protein
MEDAVGATSGGEAMVKWSVAVSKGFFRGESDLAATDAMGAAAAGGKVFGDPCKPFLEGAG